MQTKLHSLLESLINIAIGYCIAIVSQLLILPLFGIDISIAENFQMAACFTGISIIRIYVIRRWFTKRTERV